MVNLGNPPMVATTSSFVAIATIFLLSHLYRIDAQIGVAYGREGDNLPSPQEVVNLYKSNGIGAMRIYFPDQETLKALQGSGIKLTLGVGMDEIQSLRSQSVADQWVQTNVVPYISSVEIKYIVVGNEIKPSDPHASSIVPTMQNILNALNRNNLGDRIKISTSIGTELVINAYPPSNGQFSDVAYMTPIIKFLNDNGSPLMANIYPYFAHKFGPNDISLEYALFTMPYEKAVTDFNNGLKYQNVFDALADATYAAIDKVVRASALKTSIVAENMLGASNGGISLMTSESGWSSRRRGFGVTRHNVRRLQGGGGATVENAKTYYTNLIEHVKKGTPLRPGKPIETFLFVMFDEDKKNGDSDEQNFGLFTPNMQPKYGSLNFGG
ncbi:Glucan endo-1 3-beta-glucosidase [Bienertia sinuspersici]